MVSFSSNSEAFGKPGLEPKWTRSNKDGVGTAYSADSKIWFSLWRGIITEVYYPTIDRPQLRDLEFLLTDGETFFHEEKRNLESKVERISKHSLGYKVTSVAPNNEYAIQKEVISDPHLPSLLLNIRLECKKEFLDKLKIYALCAPHLEVGGRANNAYVLEVSGKSILAAEKNGTWLALGGSVPFSRASCGYVGASDGWTDISSHLKMEWEFGRALDGNVALTGQLDLSGSAEFTLALAFGDTLHSALSTLFQSLGTPFLEQKTRFAEQWYRAYNNIQPIERSPRKSDLYHGSYSLLLSHEDKSYPGAIIASLTIPWGASKGDEDMGGYHLVWTRDMVNTATAMMAAGNTRTPLRALIYLAVSQQEDGSFPQNFWINGDPYWGGKQLDEVAFPLILAWRLHAAKALEEFDPYPMVLRGAAYLISHGPATQQERWEEASGYSPSTIASNVTALICVADLLRAKGDYDTATYLEEYADFLEGHIEDWTVTTKGTLVSGIERHYIRICPADVNDPAPTEDPNNGVLRIANQPPSGSSLFKANEIVDAGFLELVRYGIRRADDAVIVDSLKVVDQILGVETPLGPCFHRYNHDGYGQREDGGPFEGWGKGRAWPLLTGERGHYELAAGHDVEKYVSAMENFASTTDLLTEQVWDEEDRPDQHLYLGRPTGAAMPLMWAHAEYIKLLRSLSDGKVFDQIPEVTRRYILDRSSCKPLEIWKFNRQVSKIKSGRILRIQARSHFKLHWTVDEWVTTKDTDSTPTILGVEYVDVPSDCIQDKPVRFTFFWTQRGAWDGQDYSVTIT